MMRARILIATLLVVFSAATTNAQDKTAKRPITLEDLWKVQRLGKPAISPNGEWIAVEVTKYSMDDNSSTSNLWLLSTDGKTQKQLTTAKGGGSGPVWSPDGKSIAFVAKRAGNTAQIYVISPAGGEAKQLTKLPMSPTGLKWGADGKTLYCVVWTWPDTPDNESYRKKEKAKKDDKVQAYIINDALYRVWDHWIADGKRPVVFAVDAEKGTHRNLFAGAKRTLPVSGGSASDYDVSPDGKEICFTSESAKELGMDYNLDLYVMPIDPSRERKRPVEPKNITADNPANDFNPAFSYDGKWIAFNRQTIKYFYADRSRMMLHDRASGKNSELTAKLDHSCGAPVWSANSDVVLFEAEEKGYVGIFFASVSNPLLNKGDTGTYIEKYSDRSLAMGRNPDTINAVRLRSSFSAPPELHTAKAFDNKASHFNDALRAQWDLGEVKNVTYKGADNEDVQMWIVYPPGFDAKKKWPLLMVVHGGPHNGITTDFSFRWNAHLFASKGYVVAIPNFHGSSGFGQKFTDSITGDMATKPFMDVMKATDYMVSQPYIDKNRLAAAGGSYGGYMMAWLNGHTDRFKTMICHAGVYNWHSMMASDFVRARERPLGALPFGDQSKIDKQNPQRFAGAFKTPTLVMHGEKDFRVPVTQGFEYYNTLRLKGVPTRLVYFPDENHWVLRPQNARLWHREFFAWLEKYVGSGPTK